MDVTRAAAAADTGAALQALDEITADLEATSARGRLSADKKRSISTVIAAVRADLSTVQLSAPAASVTKAGDVKPTEPASPPADSAPEPAPQPATGAPVQLDAPVAPAPASVIAEPVPAPDPVVIQEAPAPSPEPADNNGNGKGGLGKGQDK